MNIPGRFSVRVTRRLLLAGGVTVVAATLGTAAAVPALLTSSAAPSPASRTGAASTAAKGSAHPGLEHAGIAALAGITAKDTGLTTDAVRADLAAGKSLDTIAGSKDAQVKADALAALKARLDKAVGKGKLTAAQEQKILTGAPAAIAKAMAATRSPRSGGRHEIRQALLSAVEKQTGQTEQQIHASLAAGKSLDDIVGSKSAAVKSEVLAALKTKLDGAVASGKLTAAAEQKLLAAAPAALDKAMAAHHTPRAHSAPTSTSAQPAA